MSKKCCKEKYVDLLLIGKGEKNTYDSLNCGRKYFCCCFLHAFITEKVLKRHIKKSFQINGKQRYLRNVKMLNSKI